MYFKLCAHENHVRIALLHPSGPSNTYRYPQREHIVSVELRHVLTSVDPRSRSGRVYTLFTGNTPVDTARSFRMWLFQIIASNGGGSFRFHTAREFAITNVYIVSSNAWSKL